MPPPSVEIRFDQRRLLVDGKAVALGSRAFDLLHALVERRDRVVTKNELLDLVWPGTVVEENNLQVQVSTLRKLLGNDAISTIPGRGYRFTFTGATIKGGSQATPDHVLGDRSERKEAERAEVGNVPRLVEAPIGRDAELDALGLLIEQHRLVSIIGAGGIGKTTVGLALAQRMRADFEDGVWWIELAALTDGALLFDTVARSLGVQLGSGRALGEMLAAALRDMNTLIVLDNCEHLSAAVAELVGDVLGRARGVRFVVTSQEPLKIAYEQAYRLDPLQAPGADTALAPEQGMSFAAVRLFVERARAADRRFELSAANVEAIGEICRRLDGLPLAIELAAARTPLMGAEGVRQRLGERFRMLTAGSRSKLRRQQTLRAALEWSHGLLEPEEQAVFRRMGVFSGGATLAMVQAVATDDALDEWAVLSALGGLVDKSLVVAHGGDEPRYRLLETTRAYALEQLAAAGETPLWMRRHARAVLDMLTSRTSGLRFNDRVPSLVEELDNFRAAFDWAFEHGGDSALGLELTAVSFHLWRANANTGEGQVRAARAVRHLGDETPDSVRAMFWLTYARLGMFSSDTACFAAAQRAADLMRELDDRAGLYDALAARAAIGARRHDLAAAHAALSEARRIEDSGWKPDHRSVLAFAEWLVALRERRYADAREHAHRQADLCRASGNAFGVLMGLGNAGSCDVFGGEPERGARQLREVIAELERRGAAHSAGHFVYNLAYALYAQGDLEGSLAEARRAYALLCREGDQAILLHFLARLASARGEVEDALRILGYARAYWGAQGMPAGNLSDVELASGVAPAQREALLEQGSRLTEDQAFELVLKRTG